jgi:hypothetical protein
MLKRMINLLQSLEIVCSVILGGCFGISILHKLSDYNRYTETIISFSLLPNILVHPSAILVLVAEGLVIVLMLFERSLAFALSSVLLIIFTIALASLMVRKMSVACHCFSNDQTPVGMRSICRNISFIACSWAGLAATSGELMSGSLGMMVAIALTFLWLKPAELTGNVYHLFSPAHD